LKRNDKEKKSSGLMRGSEPLSDVKVRGAAKKDADDDGKDGLPGDSTDDDGMDGDAVDSDTTDSKDTGDRRDSDGKD
jgi:hypothetical protein